MTKGELDDARRRALAIFDDWVECTGFVRAGDSYYYELQSILFDTVHCGAQAATGDFKRLESEVDQSRSIPGWRSPSALWSQVREMQKLF